MSRCRETLLPQGPSGFASSATRARARWSHGSLSSSVSATPFDIFSIASASCKSSASTNTASLVRSVTAFKRSQSAVPTVVFPLPATPNNTNARDCFGEGVSAIREEHNEEEKESETLLAFHHAR